MRSDANFDGMAESFEEEIYGSSRGYVRERVLWEDLSNGLPCISRGGLSILDAGGGAGCMAVRMASLGNRVLLCDPSREMLDRAEEHIREANLSNCVTTTHSSIQDLKSSIDGGFDVVACHAVLEWLADPKTTLGCLVELMKPGGSLSLRFYYNRNAVLLKQIFGGEFVEALRERREGYSPRGWGDGATPLAEETVCEWLDEYGLAVGSKSGLRIFHDHLPEDARSRDLLDGLLEVERELRKQEPFASLGQHIHLICERSR